MKRTWIALGTTLVLSARTMSAQMLLVPMDDGQQNHLKAYGLVYNALKDGQKAEWLLNYRGGAFFLPDLSEVRRRAALAGVTIEPETAAAIDGIRRELASGNMDAVPLEKAPKVAIYTPPNSPPWDDAVTLALRYAGIEFEKIWDDQVLNGDLSKYDWVHLFHEDFTGQQNKLYLGYRDAPWYVEQRQRALATAQQFSIAGGVPGVKKAVADRIRQYVENGGFLFAMCGATESLDLADRGTRRGFRGAAGRRHAPRPGRRPQVRVGTIVRVQGRARRGAVRERVERHRRTSGERPRPAPAVRRLHAVRLRREVRSGGHDARAEPPRRHRRLLRRHDVVQQGDVEARRDGAGDRRGRAMGQVHPW